METSRKNFVLGVLHEGLWGLGTGLCNPVTILPLALADLGGSAALAGLLAGLLFAMYSAPQWISAHRLSPAWSDPKRCALLHSPAILAQALAALLFLALPSLPAPWKLALFIALFSAHYLGIGLIMPHWLACIGRCMPEGARGRYFGSSFAFSGAMAGLGGLLAGWWAAKAGLRWGFGMCFALAVPAQVACVSVLSRLKPLLPAPDAPPSSLAAALRENLALLRGSRLARATLLLFLVMPFAGAAGSLFTVYLREVRGLPAAWFGPFSAALSLGGMAGSFLLGLINDRRGPRVAMLLAFAAMLCSLAALAWLHRPGLLCLAFLSNGFWTSAFAVVNLVLLLDLAGPARVPSLTGLVNTLMAPFILAAPWLAGVVAQRFRYSGAFLLSALACLAGPALLAAFPGLGARGKSAPQP